MKQNHIRENSLGKAETKKVALEMQKRKLHRTFSALKDSHTEYLDIYQDAPFPYLIVNEKGLITKINQAGEKLLGANCKVLIYSSFAEFVESGNKNHWQQQFLNMLEETFESEPQGFELVLSVSNNIRRPVYVVCQRKTTPRKPPTLSIGIIDLSLLKTKQNDSTLATMAFKSQTGIYITDADRVILLVNEAFTKITGFKG